MRICTYSIIQMQPDQLFISLLQSRLWLSCCRCKSMRLDVCLVHSVTVRVIRTPLLVTVDVLTLENGLKSGTLTGCFPMKKNSNLFVRLCFCSQLGHGARYFDKPWSSGRNFPVSLGIYFCSVCSFELQSEFITLSL